MKKSGVLILLQNEFSLRAIDCTWSQPDSLWPSARKIQWIICEFFRRKKCNEPDKQLYWSKSMVGQNRISWQVRDKSICCVYLLKYITGAWYWILRGKKAWMMIRLYSESVGRKAQSPNSRDWNPCSVSPRVRVLRDLKSDANGSFHRNHPHTRTMTMVGEG